MDNTEQKPLMKYFSQVAKKAIFVLFATMEVSVNCDKQEKRKLEDKK